MSGLLRRPVLALGVPAAALAICMVRPSLEASCAMGANPVQALGGCAIALAGAREATLIAVVIGTMVGAIILGSIGLHALLHHRVSRRLRRQARPAVVAAHAVGVVPGIGAALVAGIRDPRIYCAQDLVTRLDAEELRAVLLHERHHELVHAPARLVVLSALAPFLGLLGSGSAWLERERARIEIAADEHAIRHGARCATLARAILKLRDTPPTLSLAGFATASDLRLRALLGDDIGAVPYTPGGAGTAIGAAVVAALLCSALSLL